MKIVVRPSANKDVKSLPKSVKETIERIVLQIIEAKSLSDISNVKNLKVLQMLFALKLEIIVLVYSLKTIHL